MLGFVCGNLFGVLSADILGDPLLVVGHSHLLFNVIEELLQLCLSLLQAIDLKLDVDQAHHLDVGSKVLVDVVAQGAFGVGGITGSKDSDLATLNEGLNDGGSLREHGLQQIRGDTHCQGRVGTLGNIQG